MTNALGFSDLSGFETKLGPFAELREIHDFAWSDTCQLFVGSNGSQDFRVDFDYWYERPIDSSGKEEVESDTLYIHHMSVSEGHGLGSAVTSAMIDHAKDKNIHAARMGIINPRVVGIISKLQRRGVILSSFYRIERGVEIRPMPPTATIMGAPDILTAGEAIDQFERINSEIAEKELDDEGALGDCVFIDCAVFF